MNRWMGRVALVTGANSGIGAEISKSLVKNGMKVIGADINVDKIESVASGENGSLTAFECDVTKDEQIESLFNHLEEKFGGIDICVNNAGIVPPIPLLAGNTKLWRKMLDTNLLATCYCSKLSVDLMRKNNVDDGHIINIASIMGSKVFQSSATHFYSVTKFGVKAFTEGLRLELREAKSSIKVTSICPGLVRTNLFTNAKMSPEQVEKLLSTIPSMEPKDIADTVEHVISTPPNVQINDIIIYPTGQIE